MQLAVIEYARNVSGLDKANSVEFGTNPPHPVIDLMPDQRGLEAKGGTMRLGAYPCKLVSGSRAYEIYGKSEISERHRHRFEFNNDYREKMESSGLMFSGTSPDDRLVEMVELPEHPYFIACQFHPEFKSQPNNAHPMFKAFVKAAIVRREAAGRGPTTKSDHDSVVH